MDWIILIYALISVIIVSLISLIGVVTLSIKERTLKKFLLYFVSFAAGALLADVFVHLLPEFIRQNGFTVQLSIYLLLGIIISFVIEKIIHWRHCHHLKSKKHPHTIGVMNLVGDGLHNFLDGLILGISFLISIPVGIATTIAVLLHEIPQEIGDFSILLHAGYSRKKALFFNFIIALTAVLGVIIAIVLSTLVEGVITFLIPFAAGTFIYIAAADFIPELHKENKIKNSAIQLLSFIAGIAIMFLLLLIG